jgi:CP family cyanate transporter-like MFS transporter
MPLLAPGVLTPGPSLVRVATARQKTLRTALRETGRHPVAVGAALILVALNLRFAIAAVSPVLDDLRGDLGLSSVGAGLLTTAPVLCFAVAAPLAPVLARRVGQEVLLLASMLTVALGVAIRAVPAIGAVFAGTLVLGIAIAVANVLMPSVIKRRFTDAGPMMALYTTSLSVSAAIAAAASVPVEHAVGSWHWALALWAVPALLAAAAWLPASHSAGATATPGSEHRVSLRRDPVAWLVTGAFGVQSLLFYGLLSWLPAILRAAGMSSGRAGTMLAIAMICGLPASLLVPVIAGRLRDQRPLAVVAPAFWAAGLLGVLLAPNSLTVVWMVLLGLGQGAGIALTLTLVVLRAPDAARAASLSGMAQGLGYGLAAIGPVALGAVHQISGSWDLPLVLMLAATLALLACGLGAAAPRLVGGRSDG